MEFRKSIVKDIVESSTWQNGAPGVTNGGINRTTGLNKKKISRSRPFLRGVMPAGARNLFCITLQTSEVSRI